MRPNLTLNLGLRYEYVSAPDEAAGRIDYIFKSDKDNWERFPREFDDPAWNHTAALIQLFI